MLQLDAWEQAAALSGDLWGCLENEAQDGWKSRGFQGDWLSCCSCQCFKLGDCAKPFTVCEGELGFFQHPLAPNPCSDGCIRLVLFHTFMFGAGLFSPSKPGPVCC